MNALDVAIVAIVVLSGLAGWRFGFAARAFAWGGVALAVAIGLPFVSRVVTNFGGTSSDGRVTVGVIYLAVLAVFGQAVGLGVGVYVHWLRDDGRPLSRWNRGAGAAIGAGGAVLLVWLLAPSLALTNSWLSRAGDGSAVVGFANSHAPDPPSDFLVFGKAISHARYPTVSNAAGDDPAVTSAGPYPKGVDEIVDARVRRSVVKVDAVGCRVPLSGTGWVAAPHLVVTNAHVVAGAERTTVLTEGEGKRDATVVVFDENHDLAVLSVPGLEAPALDLGHSRRAEEGAIYGHPYGGSLQRASAIVLGTAEYVVKNLYGRWGTRDVISIAANVRPGDSGGPLVDDAGDVLGVTFAKRGGTGYAVPAADVEAVLAAPPHAGVHSACIGR